MLRPFCLLTAFLAATSLATAVCSAAVTFDLAHIGNAGNAADPETGFGAVAYNYAIAKHEVTNAQYAEFLSAVDPTGGNGLGLYNTLTNVRLTGIVPRPSHETGSKYRAVEGRENYPVSNVSWYDAVRFVNWMHNGQGSGNTETGAYTIVGGQNPIDGLSIVRNSGARWWLPSEDEWYKAAYHDGSAGTAGNYFDYANGSDIAPVSDKPSDNSAAANYNYDDGLPNGFNDGTAMEPGNGRPVLPPFSNVGAYSTAISPYGTFDQNGNVIEWNETAIGDGLRGVRGGGWASPPLSLQASRRDYLNNHPLAESPVIGFRIATVPEPTSLALAAMLACCGLMGRQK